MPAFRLGALAALLLVGTCAAAPPSHSLQPRAGHPLATAPSERLGFADGDLIGYDHWHDHASLTTRASGYALPAMAAATIR
jgi:hypothetical protein